MADDLHYVPGDFYRLDDRSGFKVRASKQKKEWTELIVHVDLWEVRQPQDFVKGVEDRQDVPEPRPRPSQDPTVGWIQSTLAVFAAQGTTRLTLASSTGFSVGDVVEIMLDNNELFRTTIVTTHNTIPAPLTNLVYFQNTFVYQAPPQTTVTLVNVITIANPLPYHAAVGNIIEDLTNQKVVAPSRAELTTDLNG